MLPDRDSIPTGQEWLLDRIKKLNPLFNSAGICFGVAHMGMQAILAKDTTSFHRRLKLINDIPLEKFSETINALTQKRIEIIADVKKSIGPFRELTSEEIKELLSNDKILGSIKSTEQIIENLAHEKKLSDKQKEEEFITRINTVFFNAFSQKKIEQAMLNLTEDERIKLDIPTFIEGLLLFQNLYSYPQLFGEIKPDEQDATLSMLFTLPEKLEKEGVCKLSIFTGIYTNDELKEYFSSLTSLIQEAQLQFPFAIVLRNINHAITIGYDPQTKWLYINANWLSLKYFDNLSDPIIHAFATGGPPNGITAFSTEIYVNKSDEGALRKHIDIWQDRKNFKTIHLISEQKAKYLDTNGCSWYLLSKKHGEHEVAEKLLKAGEDRSLITKTGTNALILSIIQNDLNSIKELLSAKVDPNINKDGITPLFVAVQFNHFDIVKELLAAKADPNINKDGVTPLLLAAQRGHFDMVKALLNANADPNIADKEGVTPLQKATKIGHVEIVRELLKAKADPNLANNSGVNPLFIATLNGYFEVVKELLATKANPHLTMNDGTTPLYIAAQEGHLNILKELLATKANANLTRKDGHSPLLASAFGGHINIVKELLAAKADPNLASKEGITPLFVAAQNGKMDVVQLLLDNDAQTSILFNTSPNSLRNFASKRGKGEQMEIFLKNKLTPPSNSLPGTVSISAEEIANVMGHKEVAELIRQHDRTSSLQNKKRF